MLNAKDMITKLGALEGGKGGLPKSPTSYQIEQT